MGFDADYPALFDPGYMQALFRYGYARMAQGKAWSDCPPQLLSAAHISEIDRFE